LGLYTIHKISNLETIQNKLKSYLTTYQKVLLLSI